MKNLQATFSSKDQNWQKGSTTYWFDIDFQQNQNVFYNCSESETIGIVDSCGNLFAIDSKGYPIEHELDAKICLASCKITDEIRAK